MPKLSDFSSGAGYPDRALDFLVKGPTPAEVNAWLLDENNVAAFVTMVQGPHFDGALNASTALGSMFGSADVADSLLTNTRIFQRIEDATAWANIQSELAWINIADNETAMNGIVATDANVSVIAASPTAMSAFDTNERALRQLICAPAGLVYTNYVDITALAANSAAMTAVAASSVAMDALAASPVALDAVAASSVAMDAVIASPTALATITASSVAMDAVAASSVAMTAVAASSVAMDAVIASSVALDAVIASSVAMDAVAASSVAMDVVAASSVAMTTVAASQVAIDAVAASATAMTSIRNSTVAMQALRDSPLALEAQSANFGWENYTTIGAASNQVSIIIDFRWDGAVNGNPTFLRTLYPGGGEVSDVAWTSATFQPVGYAFSNVEARSSSSITGRIRYVRYIPTTIPNPV